MGHRNPHTAYPLHCASEMPKAGTKASGRAQQQAVDKVRRAGFQDDEIGVIIPLLALGSRDIEGVGQVRRRPTGDQ